mgnify:CR=1 FL=1
MKAKSNIIHIWKNRILVTGAYGLLGSNLAETIADGYERFGMVRTHKPDFDLSGVTYVEGDIVDRKRVLELVKKIQPNIIINAAAYTNVDKSEVDREACWKTNVEGVANLAYAARLIDARLVHVSTDYVFDGKKQTPYKETDRTNPLGFYAKSKLAGENALHAGGGDFAIARTMILYGYSRSAGPNFVTWVIEQLRNKQRIRIVDDQIGQPTLASELAAALLKLAESDCDGIFHISGTEALSRYDFTLEIAKLFDLDTNLIERIKTTALEQPAPRPMHSVFDLTRLETELGVKMSGAADGLEKFKARYPLQ